jgi:2-methylisocitrate lyase-like PEP mutase family enzyme
MSFADLHQGPEPLVLPNAWDVPSALAFADAGWAAIGTTSFGVASVLGRPDGGRATRDANVVLARALAALPCFVTMDIEDGYADSPEEVADYVALLDVAGVNIEDSTAERLVEPQAFAAKVAAIKERRPDLFVNARTDTYWLGQDAKVDESLRRASAYVEAGADGVFVPGATDPDVIRTLAAGIARPLNVLAVPGLGVAALGELGVRRVSTGSLPYRAALRAAADVAERVRDGDDPPPAFPYPLLQERMRRHQQAAAEEVR